MRAMQQASTEPATGCTPPCAVGQQFAAVYQALRDIAHQRLARHVERATIGTTALVHEAYIRLAEHSSLTWADRAHFFALASRAMRFVLLDYARERGSQKRGGEHVEISLDNVELAADERAVDVLALSEALDELGRIDSRLSRIVEYRFFGGLTFDEVAVLTGLSVPTVKRDWTRARAWLHRALDTGLSTSPRR